MKKKRKIKPVINIAHSFEEAEQWDIQQQINMTPQQRFSAYKEMIKMVYGKNPPDIRECHHKNPNLQVIRKMF